MRFFTVNVPAKRKRAYHRFYGLFLHSDLYCYRLRRYHAGGAVQPASKMPRGALIGGNSFGGGGASEAGAVRAAACSLGFISAVAFCHHSGDVEDCGAGGRIGGVA